MTTPITQTGGSTSPHMVGATVSHWTASGFVGGSFGAGTENLSGAGNSGGVDYGGQIAYLWRGIIGPEFLYNTSPNTKLNSAFLASDAKVNSYMGNIIAALPAALWLTLPGLPIATAAIGFVTAQVTVRRWLRRLP